MDEAEDLLEESWFFGNLLDTKTRNLSRSFSDLASSSCFLPHPYPPLSSNQESGIKNECKNSSFSSRNQSPISPPSLTRTPSLPNSIETQSFSMKNPNPNRDLIPFVVESDQEDVIFKNERKSSNLYSRKQPPAAPPSLSRTPSLPNSIKTQSFLPKNANPNRSSMPFIVGSDQEDVIVKNERKSSTFSSRKQPPVAPRSLTRAPSLPNSIETQSFPTKKPNPNRNLTRASSSSSFVDASDQENAIERKSSSFSSRKQPPITPPSLIRTPSLPNSIKTQSFLTKNPNPSHDLTRTSSNATSIGGSDQEDEDDDQESEFTLGRLIRQASINLSPTSNPPQQTSKVMIENMQKIQEVDQEKISDMKKMEKNRSKSTKNMKSGAPTIPGGCFDKSSSEDMKAHIKFWARAVATNVRQECS